MNLTPDIIDEEGKGILFARVASKLLNEGNIDQATFISEVGIKKYPNYAQGHYVLGKCYQDKDMYDEARAEYERVLRYDSSHLGAMKELAGLYSSTGLEDVYKDYLYRLLTLDPLNSKVLDECKEKGVYEIWVGRDNHTFEPVIDTDAQELKVPETDLQKESETIEDKFEDSEKDTEDVEKIDLTQFENQNDDFTTIMDGLIQESGEDGQEVDASNYLEDLESPMEIESELLAEEKPIEDHIDDLDAFENEQITNDTQSSYLELDYSQKKGEQNEEDQDDNDDSFVIENEEERVQLQEEIKKEPEEVENAFDEPKPRVEDIEVKEESFPRNAHDKTELIFEESANNVELQFEEEKEEELKETDIKIEPESVPEVSEETKDLTSDPEIEDENAQEDKSPYVKQKIISQTLGEILVSQNKYKEAKEVFVALKEQQPDNPNIDKKLEILDKIITLEEKKDS